MNYTKGDMTLDVRNVFGIVLALVAAYFAYSFIRSKV